MRSRTADDCGIAVTLAWFAVSIGVVGCYAYFNTPSVPMGGVIVAAGRWAIAFAIALPGVIAFHFFRKSLSSVSKARLVCHVFIATTAVAVWMIVLSVSLQ